MGAEPKTIQELVLSYLGLRKAVGLIGILLPVVLVLGNRLIACQAFEPTISDFYYTVMRGVFVGSLWSVAIFLISYRYDVVDDIAGDIGGIFAIGVALFPTTPHTGFTSTDRVIGGVHYGCAAGFFLTLAFFSLVLFRKTDGNPTPRKRQRNWVYLVCGIVMLLCMALIALVVVLVPDDAPINRFDPVFWLETIALWAFGGSWFIKGETLLRD